MDELLKYYEYLKSKHADVPDTFESFHNTLRDDISAKKYYEYLRDNDFDAPDSFESFQKTFDLKKKSLPLGPGVAGPPEQGVLPPESFAPSPAGAQSSQTESQVNAPEGDLGKILVNAPAPPKPQTDFGNMTIEQIDEAVRAENAPKQEIPGIAIPDFNKKAEWDRPVAQPAPSQNQLAENRFAAEKSKIWSNIQAADKAQLSEELKNVAGNMSRRISAELEKLPPDKPTPTGFTAPGEPPEQIRPETTPRMVMGMAKDLLDQVAESGDQQDFWEGLTSRGVVNALPFISGLSDIPTLQRIYEASQKEKPSQPEQNLLDAETIRREFESAKEKGGMFRAGQVLADMIPYIGEYALTGGFYSSGRELAISGMKAVLKNAATKPAVVKGVINPIATLIGVGAQTAANPQAIIKTTLERMTPQMRLAVDMDSNDLHAVMGQSGEDFKKAFAKAFGTNALEYLTERFGQWGNDALKSMKMSGDWLPQVIFGKWMEKRGFKSLDEASKVAHQIGYDGIIQEIWVEEYPNKLLQNAVTGDQEWTPDFFNPFSQEFIDMIPSVLLMEGGTHLVNKFAGQKTTQNEQVNNNPPEAKTTEKEPEPTPAPSPKTRSETKQEPINVPKDLKERGEEVVNMIDAKRRFDAGERIFAFHDMEGEPTSEIKNVGELDKYTHDQLLAYPEEKYVPQDGWETHLIKARDYAAHLGIDWHGKGLTQLVSEIQDKVNYVQVSEDPAEQKVFDEFGNIGFTFRKGPIQNLIDKIKSSEMRFDDYSELGRKASKIANDQIKQLEDIQSQGFETLYDWAKSQPKEGEQNAIQRETTQVGTQPERIESTGGRQGEGVGQRSEGQETPVQKEPEQVQKPEEKVTIKDIAETEFGKKHIVIAKVGEDSNKAVVDQISDLIGKEKLNKKDIESIGKEHGIEDKNKIKELTELAIVQKARELANKDDFEGLVKLYDDQPTLGHRTNESIEKQQYSTPAPIAYLGGKYVNAGTNQANFEPSAGNGMLTIVGKPGSYTVNEIDQTRLKNLQGQGFKSITSQDGSQEFNAPRTYDAVITNPPFGGTQAVEIDGVKFNELAQIMAVRALNTMKDDGKAFIIIGGNNKYDEQGRLTGRDWRFFNFLYHRYNVDDVIDVSGDLYRKQGASFPIRVILVNGRKATPQGVAPLKSGFGEQVESFEELKDRVDKFTSERKANENLQPEELVGGPAGPSISPGTGERGKSVKSEPTTVPTGEVQAGGTRSSGRQGELEGPSTVGSRTTGNGNTESGRGVNSGRDTGERTNVEQAPVEGRVPGSESEQSGGTGEPVESRARGPRKIAEGDASKPTVDYKPLSKGTSLDLQSPTGMRQEVLDAQTDLEADVGDVDEFVQQRLGYKSKKEMFNALGAEQIDGVALAIRNIERGTGIIIGDQTGVGKGRQAAAIIRYATQQKLNPIFLTEKPNLFSDLYRDLSAIGSGDLVPFVVNSRGDKFNGIADEDGVIIHKAPSASDKAHRAFIQNGRIPNDADFILATYSQFSSPRYADKISFIQRVAQGNILILDESHNASGEGNTSSLFQGLLPNTKGVVYLSGTFAKRADNMPVYALKTSMREANLGTEDLINAVEAGGVPLQEIISSQLAQSGEMVRRERTFEGIDVKFNMSGGDSKEVRERQLKQANQVTEIMNDIIRFQQEEVVPVIKAMDQQMKAEGEKMGLTQGTNMAGVDNTPYFSKVFNVINQLLYALKAKDTADQAIAEIKEGRKPFIAIRSTMEAMLKDLVDRGEIKIGDALDPDFRFILKKGLEGVMKMTTTDAEGNKKSRFLSPDELFGSGKDEFRRIMAKIGKLKTGLTLSPIDEFVQAMEAAGYKVGEVTGRQLKIEFKGDHAILRANKKQPVNELYRKYNSGELDVLIVNSSGSTGASAHSDKNFKDQRQRSMLILEPELNISTLVQLLGRVNRTNQINKPVYTFISSHVPAEQRLMMMTMRKLKSLSANTTSNQKQSNSIINVPEIFNKHGDQVVIEYLQENPELIQELGNPLKSNDDGTEPQVVHGAANKVTGRVAILPTDKQATFYAEIADSYAKHIQFLNDSGMNDLEISSLPLRAKTRVKKPVIMGNGGRTRFGDDTYLEEVEADVLKKPMTKEEITKSINDLTGGNENVNERYRQGLEEYRQKHLADIRATVEARVKKAYDAAVAKGETPPQSLEEMVDEHYNPKAEREDAKMRYVESILKFFTPGRAVRVPFTFDSTTGASASAVSSPSIFLGFDINENSAKPYLPSKVVLKFAVNDSRRILSIPASKMGIVNTIRSQSYDMSDNTKASIQNEWDSLKKPKARGKRYIVTGNVLQGLGNSTYRDGGQIVKYTTEEGHVETGILMNEDFDPKEEGNKEILAVPASKMTPFITAAPVWDEFVSTNKHWTIVKKSNNKYSLRVPKAKQVGGKYYLDPQINDLVDYGRWDSVGNAMEAFTDGGRLEDLMKLLTEKHRVTFELTSREAIDKLISESSERSAGTYEDFSGAMSSLFPVKVSGKVKKQPTNKALLNHLKKQNMTDAELEEQLKEAIKFSPEIEQRFKEAGEPAKSNMAGILTHIKDFISGFSSHFKYLPEKKFPREANILREFEGLKKWANAESNIYIKGLIEPLTEQQYQILSRRIILADMLESIDKGLNMTGLDGKLPFGFADRAEVAKDLKKFEELSDADPAIDEAFEKRDIFMRSFKDMLINSGLLSENDIDQYYHRRVLAHQHDEVNKSILFGKDIADKKRDFQRMRTGTRGMDYSTNFIETEYKVVAEGLYELEKQRILKDLMSPYERMLQGLKREFNKQFESEIEYLENQYGKDSIEAEMKKSAKRALMKTYLEENIPEGYTFYRVSDDNRLFWAKTVSQQALDKAIAGAELHDDTGAGQSVDIIDGLISDLNVGLVVGAKRKQYMIPQPLAEQLEEMAKNETLNPPEAIFRRLTDEWKKLVLLSPNRLLRYSLNNFGGDLDRALQVEPKILKFTKEAFNELWDFHQTGKVTPQMLEAMRGSVIDSGFEISELSNLSKQQWVTYFLDMKDGPSIDDIFGKKWTTDMTTQLAKKPGQLYEKYMEWATKYTRLRENTLRYAAYKLAAEKSDRGDTFYWASDKNSIDSIKDPRQKIAKLSRDFFGDYGNISYTGQWLRSHLLPFYSWAEINLGTHFQLIKNASSPAVQRAMINSAVRRGIPYVTARMAYAYMKLFLFTAAVEAWNHFMFPMLPWVDDDDDKDAAERLRRSGTRGMQVLLYVSDDGKVHGLPIIGAFYDFVDYFGIPGAIDDIERVFTGNSPAQDAWRASKTMGGQMGGKVFQMTTPAIKMPLEFLTNQTYFPDAQNPVPIQDRGEWFFNALTLRDEYNYFLTDKPQRQSYLERKFSNSLLLREFDPDMLSYYQARRIVSKYTGRKIPSSHPTNEREQAKQQALHYYSLALRYGKTDEANANLIKYFLNGGTPRGLEAQIRTANPFNGLGRQEKDDIMLMTMAKDPLKYKPFTEFGRSLTSDERLVMKDAMKYFRQIYRR